jgi:hypothetical protein
MRDARRSANDYCKRWAERLAKKSRRRGSAQAAEVEPTAGLMDQLRRSATRVSVLRAVRSIKSPKEPRFGRGGRPRRDGSLRVQRIEGKLLQRFGKRCWLHLVSECLAADRIEDRFAAPKASGAQRVLTESGIRVQRLNRHLSVGTSQQHLRPARSTRCVLIDVGQKHGDQFGFGLHGGMSSWR